MGNTYYLDLISGDDSQTGTSYAQRRQTIAGISAWLQPGDTVLVMETARPVNTGLLATWTDQSYVVTLNTPVTSTLFNGSPHTSGGSTVAIDTTLFKATSSNHFALPASFVGKFGYYANGNAYNLSGFQQLSLWVRANQVLAAGQVTVRLCGDNQGNVATYTFAMPAIPEANQWLPVTIDFGSPLLGSISSIGLYVESAAVGNLNIWFDNIIVCAAPGAGCLTHQSLIGLSSSTGAGGDNSDTWYAIAAINDTSVFLDQSPNLPPASYQGFYGTSHTAQLWKREPLLTPPGGDQTTPLVEVINSGTAGNLITWQFGMDANAMAVQSGQTWLSGQNGMGVGLKVQGDFNAVSGLGLVRYFRGMHLNGSAGGVHDLPGIGHCGSDNAFFDGPSTSNKVRIRATHHAGAAGFNDHPAGGNNQVQLDRVLSNGTYGARIANNDLLHDGSINNNILAAIHTAGAVRGYRITTADNASAGATGATGDGLTGTYYTGLGFSGSTFTQVDPNLDFIWDQNPPIDGFDNQHWTATWDGWLTPRFSEAYTFSAEVDDGMRMWIDNVLVIDNWVFQSPHTFVSPTPITLTGGTPHKIHVEYQQGPRPYARLRLKWQSASQALEVIPVGSFSTTFPSGSSVYVEGSLSAGYEVKFRDCLFNEALEFTGLLNFYDSRVRSHNHDRQKGSHVMVTDGGRVASEAGVDRHTQSGLAWKIMPTSPRSVFYPLDYKIASIATAANKTVTLKCFFKRSDSAVTGQLLVPGGQIDGVPNDVSVTLSQIGTYEELSMTFTPTEVGIVDVYARAFGGTSSSVWVDDMTVSQS